MSADWVTQRTRGLSIWATGIEAFLQGRNKARSLIDRFVYPRFGYQRIPERLREEIEAAGSEVRLGARVLQVDHSDPERVLVRFEEEGASRELAADRVVSTIPLTELLARVLHPRPPEEVVAAASRLEFRSVICVNLMIDRPQLTRDTWIYCHDRGIGFARLHEPRNWSPEMAPEGRTGVVLEFFCHRGDEVHRKSDEELVQWGIDDLVRLGLVSRGEVLGGFAVRADEAYPVYALGYREALEEMHAHVQGIGRVSLVGRGGIFRYNNSDHSIEMGLVMARLIDSGGDESAVLRVNSSPEYSEKDLIRPGSR